MRYLLYKVNTNFFENPLNKGFQRVLLIEWEWDDRNSLTDSYSCRNNCFD